MEREHSTVSSSLPKYHPTELGPHSLHHLTLTTSLINGPISKCNHIGIDTSTYEFVGKQFIAKNWSMKNP